MNVYDTANRLASEIKNSEEYANFKESVTKVSNEVTTKLKEIKTKILPIAKPI